MSKQASKQLGDFRIIEPIGKGRMGEVYLAEHVQLRKKYALKILSAQLVRNRGFVERFHNEVRAMAGLQHEHIVQVVYMGHVEGVYFLVMDHVVGPEGDPLNLHEHLENQPKGRVPNAQAHKWAIQVAEALTYAHARGVVHGDLRPTNILIDANGDAKLTGFGLAKAIGGDRILSQIHQPIQQSPGSFRADRAEHRDAEAPVQEADSGGHRTRSGSNIPGTSDFMAPEQRGADVGQIDERMDIYSFGVLLYQLLTGRLPTAERNSPSRAVRGVSRRWDAVVGKCLRDDPVERYASAEAMLSDIRRIGRSGSHRFLAVAATVVLLAAIGVWATSWLESSPPETKVSMPVVSDQVVPSPEETQEADSASEDNRRYANATDLIEPAAAIKSLQQTELPFKEHAIIKKRWREAESFVEIATEYRDAGEWDGAGVALENATRIFEEAIELDRKAAEADTARARFANRTVEVDWFEHPVVVNEGYAEADERAAQALQAYLTGNFDDASSAWEQAIELAAIAIGKSDAARAAEIARREWDGRVSVLPEPLYDEIRPKVDELMASSPQIEADFRAGRFAEAESAWAQSTSELGELLSEHERARTSVTTARDAARQAWMRALEADAGKYAPTEWTAAETNRQDAEGHYDSGDYRGSAESWGLAERGYATSLTAASDSRFDAHLALGTACHDPICREAALSNIESALGIRPDDAQALAERDRITDIEKPAAVAEREKRKQHDALVAKANECIEYQCRALALFRIAEALELYPGDAKTLAVRQRLALITDDDNMLVPMLGPLNAPVTIVEFADFQCPYCVKEYPKLKQLLTEYPQDVKLVFKHYPLSFHKKAKLAAAAAMLAFQQKGNGAFWQMHDMIFAGGIKKLEIADLRGYARRVGLDITAFDTLMADPREQDLLLASDLADGRKYKVRGTPTVLINGLKQSPRTIEAYRSRIEKILGIRKGRAAAGTRSAAPPVVGRSPGISGELTIHLSAHIGISPMLLSYTVGSNPRSLLSGATVVWLDNGQPMSREVSGSKTIASPGKHKIEAVVTTSEMRVLRSFKTITVLERLSVDSQ